MTEKLRRAFFVQVAGSALLLVSLVLLAVGWWPLAIATGAASVTSFAMMRRVEIRERIDEVVEQINRQADDSGTEGFSDEH